MLMILAMSLLDGGSEIFETWKDPVLEILIYIYSGSCYDTDCHYVSGHSVSFSMAHGDTCW